MLIFHWSAPPRASEDSEGVRYVPRQPAGLCTRRVENPSGGGRARSRREAGARAERGKRRCCGERAGCKERELGVQEGFFSPCAPNHCRSAQKARDIDAQDFSAALCVKRK